MEKIKIKMSALYYNPHLLKTYIAILYDDNTKKKIPIVIKPLEASIIAQVLEKIDNYSMGIYSTLDNLIKEHGIKIDDIFIYKVEEGIFYAKIKTLNKIGDEIIINSSIGEAIAISNIYNCPIYTTASIIENFGFLIDELEIDNSQNLENERQLDKSVTNFNLDYLTVEQLEILLSSAIEEENYEDAAEIRDLIKNKKK